MMKVPVHVSLTRVRESEKVSPKNSFRFTRIEMDVVLPDDFDGIFSFELQFLSSYERFCSDP